MKSFRVSRVIGLFILACVVMFPFQAYAAAGHGHIRAALSTIDLIKSRSDAQPADKELGVLRNLFFSGDAPKDAVVKAFVRGAVVPDNLGVFIGSICDAGNFPHYGDTGLFYSQLLAEADEKANAVEDKREEYIAYALGALSHYVTDKYSHPIVNEFAGGVYEEPGDHPVVEVNLDDGSISADSFFIPDDQVTTKRHKFYEFWLVRHMLDMNKVDSGKLADNFNYYDFPLTCDNGDAYAAIIDATFTKIWGSWWSNLGITPATIKAADFSMAGFIDYINYCYIHNIAATTMNLPIPLPKILLPTKEVSEKFQNDLLSVNDPNKKVLYSTLTGRFINCLNNTAPDEIIKVFLRAAPFLEDKVLSKITLNDLKLENINLDSGKLTTKQENTTRDVPEVSNDLNPEKTKVYIANQGGNTLKSINIQNVDLFSKLDVNSQSNVTVDSNPQAVVFDPTGRFAWVANKVFNTISWVDTVKNEEIDQNKTDNIPFSRLQVGSDPVALAITPDGSLLCVANNGSSSVSIIDVAKREIKNTILVSGGELKDIKIDPQGKYAFVSVQKPGADNSHPGVLKKIDLQTNVDNIWPLELSLEKSDKPRGLMISPDGNELYLTDKGERLDRPNYFHNFDIKRNVDEPVSSWVGGTLVNRLETIDTQLYWCSVFSAPVVIGILVGITDPPGIYSFVGGYEDLPLMTSSIIGLFPFSFGFIFDMPWVITLTYKTDPLWLRQGVNVDVPAVQRYTDYSTDFLAAYTSFGYTGNIGIYDRKKKEFFAATRSIIGDEYMSRPYNRYEYLKASTIGDIIVLDKYKNIAAFYPGKKIYQVLSDPTSETLRRPIDYKYPWEDASLLIVSPGFIGGLNKPTGVDIQPMVYSPRPLTGETIVSMTKNGAQLDYMIFSHNKIVDIKVFDGPDHSETKELAALYSENIEWAQKHGRFWELIVKDTTKAPFNCALGAGATPINLEFNVTLENGAVVGVKSSPEVNNLVPPDSPELKFLTPTGIVDRVPPSNPYPTIDLDAIDPGSIIIKQDGTIQLTLAGTVSDPIADVIADGEADIASVKIEVIGNQLTDNDVSLSRDSGYESNNKNLWRPYAYRTGRFEKTITFDFVEGINRIVLQTSENAVGNQGYAGVIINIEAVTIEGIKGKEADGRSFKVVNVETLRGNDSGTFVPAVVLVSNINDSDTFELGLIDNQDFNIVKYEDSYYFGQSPPTVFIHSKLPWLRTPKINYRQRGYTRAYFRSSTKSCNLATLTPSYAVTGFTASVIFEVAGYTFEQGDKFTIQDAIGEGTVNLTGSLEGSFTFGNSSGLKNITITMRNGETFTLQKILAVYEVVKIPLGRSKILETPYQIGKIYQPIKLGGAFEIKTTQGKAQLYYKDGSDIDTVTLTEILSGQHKLGRPLPLVLQPIEQDKFGWYYVIVSGAESADVKNTFFQEAETTYRPWNGWYCPTEPNTNPNLYEESGDFTPLQDYDAKYGTSTRDWESQNHVGTLGWEGHCWGWSLASIAKKMSYLKNSDGSYTKDGNGDIIPDPARSGLIAVGANNFTKWEIRGLYTELGDHGVPITTFLVDDIPPGPFSEALGEPIDAFTKDFHDTIENKMFIKKEACSSNLRNTQVIVTWILLGVSPNQYYDKLPGVSLLSANADAPRSVTMIWDKISSTLRLKDKDSGIEGPLEQVTVSGGYKLSCPGFGSIDVYVDLDALPDSNAEKEIKTEVEVWNHSLFKYRAEYKEEYSMQDDHYLEITTTVWGNMDTPFPPLEGSFVTRTYKYHLRYNNFGRTVDTDQNWVVGNQGVLPLEAIVEVPDENAFNWYSKAGIVGITKVNVDGL